MIKFKLVAIVPMVLFAAESFPAVPKYIVHSTEAEIPLAGSFDQNANELSFLTWTVGSQSRDQLPYGGKIYGDYAGSKIRYSQEDVVGNVTVPQSVRPAHGISAALKLEMWGEDASGKFDALLVHDPALSARLTCNNPWGNCRGGVYNINFTPLNPLPAIVTGKITTSLP